MQSGSVHVWQLVGPELGNQSRCMSATISVPHSRDLFVSPRLNWRVEPLTDIAEVFEPDETYRKLDERYFGWLHSQVNRLPDEHRAEAVSLLWEIVGEAINAGVLPAEWVDRNQWPTSAPPTYTGPLLFADHCDFYGLPE